ncbi:hypothetical protein D6D19_08182 [Aureobasidium pullulans]|uniref:Protein kinase domain-containing protein n=1 Tax=Aureobasidium pullulans TaxID=5580 RepID=A0A4S8ZTS7_AURPU|nr:hypothetical protein D6D19_08182 [Aureobasidium pullulans]
MSHGFNDASGLPGGRWISPGQYIADGGQGSVHYWVKVDATHRVIDRIVIKDTWDSEPTSEPVEWDGMYEELVRKGMDLGVSKSGGYGNAHVDDRFYKEAYIQGLLTPADGESSYNMPLRGYKRGDKPDPRQRPDTTHWRLYMDHLHSGDMHTFIQKSVKLDDFGTYEPMPTPEPFIWYTLQCLTSALIQMEEAARTRPKARKAGDETIVMLDMKPSNIFLAPPGGPRYPVYPRPIIGDFGGAQLTHKTAADNVWGAMQQICTRGFYAPEMTRSTQIDEDDMEDHQIESLRVENLPVHSWTNVWQLGRSIECMMRATGSMNDVDWATATELQRESQIKRSPPRFDYSPGFQYSTDLVNLVYDCQLFNPKKRPTPRELMEQINENISDHTKFMDYWGTEAWVREQEQYPAQRTKEEKEKLRQKNARRVLDGKLYFLHDYQDKALAERYADLDMDIPEDCALVWGGNEAEYKLGQVARAGDTPQKPDKRKRSNESDDEDQLDSRLRKKPKK